MCNADSWNLYTVVLIVLNAVINAAYLCILFFCSVILFPIAVTFYVTWWFIHFVDGFFSPIYAQLGIDIFGKFFFSLAPQNVLLVDKCIYLYSLWGNTMGSAGF